MSEPRCIVVISITCSSISIHVLHVVVVLVYMYEQLYQYQQQQQYMQYYMQQYQYQYITCSSCISSCISISISSSITCSSISILHVVVSVVVEVDISGIVKYPSPRTLAALTTLCQWLCRFCLSRLGPFAKRPSRQTRPSPWLKIFVEQKVTQKS